ncbi:unnamed protein product [Larinioides sclopetarius]|uniref:Uncharacterized protein n=1 Tax=Larinioides sclopetarius TaxID=280406 RepID=A0AAV2BEY1_9ARAC
MGLSKEQFSNSILSLNGKSNSKPQGAKKPVDTVAVTIKMKQKTLSMKSKCRVVRNPTTHSKAFLQNLWYELRNIRLRHLIASVISSSLLTLCGMIVVEYVELRPTAQQMVAIELVLFLLCLLWLVYAVKKLERYSSIEVIV